MNNNRIFVRRDALAVYLFHMGAAAFLFAFLDVTFMIYQITVVGLSPLQLVLVGTALEVGVLVFEIPTGVVADVYSRRLSVIIGLFVVGIGFTLSGSIPTFPALLIGSVIWGMGHTFISGAHAAWLADEIGEMNASRAYLRGTQVAMFARIPAIFVGVFAGSINAAFPLIFGGIGYMLLGAVMIVVMPETGFARKPPDEREGWRDLFATLREGVNVVRGRPSLISLMLVGILWGASSEGFDRLWEVFMIRGFAFPPFPVGDPIVVWFGIIRVAESLLTIVIAESFRRRLARNDTERQIIWLLVAVTGTVGLALFSFAGSRTLLWAALAYLVVSSSRTAARPLFDSWVNRNVSSKVRATVMSVYGQMDAIGQMAGGPGVGAVGNASIRGAISVSATLMMTSLPLLFRATRRRASEPET